MHTPGVKEEFTKERVDLISAYLGDPRSGNRMQTIPVHLFEDEERVVG